MNAVNEVTPLLKGYAEQWKEGVTRSAGGMPPEHHHEEELHEMKALSGKWTPREICITALSILTGKEKLRTYNHQRKQNKKQKQKHIFITIFKYT